MPIPLFFDPNYPGNPYATDQCVAVNGSIYRQLGPRMTVPIPGDNALAVNMNYRGPMSGPITVTFSALYGDPADENLVCLTLDCTVASTLTFPSCKRSGSNSGAITSLAIPVGIYELVWRYSTNEWLLTDNVAADSGATELSQAQVENAASTVFGEVSGQRLSQAVAAHGGAVSALGQSDVENAASEVQGTVSGQRLAQATAVHGVVGPGSSVNNRLVLMNGTTGKLIKQASYVLGTLNTGQFLKYNGSEIISETVSGGGTQLSQAEAENAASTVFGEVSGQRLSQAVAARFLYNSDATVTLANSVALTDLLNFSLPGGTLAARKSITIRARGTFLNNTGSSQTGPRFDVVYGSQQFGGEGQTYSTSASSRHWEIVYTLTHKGASAQYAHAALSVGNNTLHGNSSYLGSKGDSWTQDSTSAQAVKIRAQFDLADANLSTTLEIVTIE